MLSPTSVGLTLIADTTERFCDFAPYVCSLNNDGLVAFQAALRGGGTGVFTGRGGPVVTVIETAHSGLRDISSHPELNTRGEISFYADLNLGGQGVFLMRDGRLSSIGESPRFLKRIGPLGPTMNDEATVAFRAELNSGMSAILTGRSGSIVTIADTGDRFVGFQGLPVINRSGTVVFRADLKGGGHGIYASQDGSLVTIADTKGNFSDLGMFPSVNDDGAAVFAGTHRTHGPGIFMANRSALTTVADCSHGFESFRGALINNLGSVFFFTTPRGGGLGIFSGTDPAIDRVFCVGDPMFDSTVASFALNPVSVNDINQLAVRVELANGRQLILRVDCLRVRIRPHSEQAEPRS